MGTARSFEDRRTIKLHFVGNEFFMAFFIFFGDAALTVTVRQIVEIRKTFRRAILDEMTEKQENFSVIIRSSEPSDSDVRIADDSG